MKPWETWRDKRARHQPDYQEPREVREAVKDLRSRPPLVFAGEVDSLRDALGRAGNREAFVLVGGDCAETFEQSTANELRLKLQTLLQMAVVLTYGASMPVVKVGRIAGQYAKPRSSPTETRDGLTLPSYLGDAVNEMEFSEDARRHDPSRLLDTYHASASSLNLIRAFTKGGYADLRRVHEWSRGFTAMPVYARYEQLAREITKAVKFMEAAGGNFRGLEQVDLFSSHEALLLEYESALTRIDSRTEQPYNTSGHFLWIGERTRGLDEAHVELLANVRNPIGVKLGPTATEEDVLGLIEKLNPGGEEGRLTFITRFGADRIEDVLPPLIDAVSSDGRPVTWISDPMHGNTISTDTGFKTRDFETIMREVRSFFDVHNEKGTVPAGIHVELTGSDVTEVIGGAEGLDADSLTERYETAVDPRLNHLQSLEIAFQVAALAADANDDADPIGPTSDLAGEGFHLETF